MGGDVMWAYVYILWVWVWVGPRCAIYTCAMYFVGTWVSVEVVHVLLVCVVRSIYCFEREDMWQEREGAYSTLISAPGIVGNESSPTFSQKITNGISKASSQRCQ